MKIEEKDGQFIITDFNEKEAYAIACKIEKDGKDFYQKLSDNEQDPGVKEALGFLISDEENHLKFFESALDSLRAQETEDDEEDDLLESLDYGIFKPYDTIEHLEEVVNDFKKALKLGLIVEKKAVEFYEKCKESVTSDLTKRELERIIQEEKKHQQIFENMLQKLQ